VTVLWFWLPAGFWAALIYLLSSLSLGAFAEAPRVYHDYALDKLAHLLVFGSLAGLLLRALRRGHRLSLPAAALLAIVATSAYGASDEWHQAFVPGRCSSAADWLADTCGALLAAWLWYRYESRTGRKEDRGTP
jgi:VanZ family protein